MAADEIRLIAEKLKKQGTMRFKEGAAESRIAEFEEAHGVRLPAGYKEWLRYSDGGEFFLPAGVQFYGVAHKPLIDVEDDCRPDDSYIVIGAMSFGDPVLCEKATERISIFNHEAGRIESDETYPDFLAFLKDLPEMLGAEG